MICKSRGHVRVISLDSFHLPYLGRICVNCLDESIALGFEEERFSLLSLAAPSRTAESCHMYRYTPSRHLPALLYVAMLLLRLYI